MAFTPLCTALVVPFVEATGAPHRISNDIQAVSKKLMVEESLASSIEIQREELQSKPLTGEQKARVLEILCLENKVLKEQNHLQGKVLKGFIVPQARDIIKQLMKELGGNEKYKEALCSELKSFCKINIDQFLTLAAREVQRREADLYSGWVDLQENKGDVAIKTDSEDMDFRDLLQQYIIKVCDLEDPVKRSKALAYLNTTLGYLGTGGGLAFKGIWYGAQITIISGGVTLGYLAYSVLSQAQDTSVLSLLILLARAVAKI